MSLTLNFNHSTKYFETALRHFYDFDSNMDWSVDEITNHTIHSFVTVQAHIYTEPKFRAA